LDLVIAAEPTGNPENLPVDRSVLTEERRLLFIGDSPTEAEKGEVVLMEDTWRPGVLLS